MTRQHITPDQWAGARQLADVRRASYIRLKSEEWCADVYNALCVGDASYLLTPRPTTTDQVVACHVVAYLAGMGFDATWYREAEGLRVYWGKPAQGQAPAQHHQHALAQGAAEGHRATVQRAAATQRLDDTR